MKKTYTVVALVAIIHNAFGMNWKIKRVTLVERPITHLQERRAEQNAELGRNEKHGSSYDLFREDMLAGKEVDLVAYEKWLRDTNHGDSAIAQALQTMKWHNASCK